MTEAATTETKAAFARRLGVSDRRVSALVADGLPVTETGKVKVADAMKWVQERQNPVRSAAGRLTGGLKHGDDDEDDDVPPPTGAAPREVIDYWAEKARKERAAASLTELKLATQKGELLPADEVRSTVFALAKAERDAWTAWPSRVAPVLAARLGCDLGEIQRALVAEVNAHLSELAEVKI